MRRFALLILCFITTTSVNAAPAFNSEEELMRWVTYYYKKPQPARIPEAVKYLNQVGALSNQNSIAPIFGFLSGVFSQNPQRVSDWINELTSIGEKELGTVVLGIWYADLPDSKARVYALLEKYPKLKSDFEYLYKGGPMAIEKIPLDQGPWVLDALWGKFMATGDVAPVERVISALPWVNVKGNIDRLMVGGSARWSLTSNAVQHKRVLEICERLATEQSSETTIELLKVIKAAKKELQGLK